MITLTDSDSGESAEFTREQLDTILHCSALAGQLAEESAAELTGPGQRMMAQTLRDSAQQYYAAGDIVAQFLARADENEFETTRGDFGPTDS